MSQNFKLRRAVERLWPDDCASQMVELAVSLPLLVVMVVGIFDFSGAYTLKQKLANAARDAARTAAADPATDVGSAAVPISVSDAFQVAKNYLDAENINDCGIAAPTGPKTGSPLTWSSSGNTPPPCSLTVDIDRGYITQSTGASGTVYVVGTQVSIRYAYKWRFNSVITLLSGKYAGPATLNTSAVAFNEN